MPMNRWRRFCLSRIPVRRPARCGPTPWMLSIRSWGLRRAMWEPADERPSRTLSRVGPLMTGPLPWFKSSVAAGPYLWNVFSAAMCWPSSMTSTQEGCTGWRAVYGCLVDVAWPTHLTLSTDYFSPTPLCPLSPKSDQLAHRIKGEGRAGIAVRWPTPPS